MSSDVANVVTLQTSEGAISIELYSQDAPRTSENFQKLALSGKYDGTCFHRIIPGVLIQGGDTNGRGGESSFGYLFEDEISPRLRHSGAGIVSSANAGPNKNGSQFFITLSPQPALDGTATIFGRVVRGMDVVAHIADFSTDPLTQRPFTSVTVKHCTASTEARQQRPLLAGSSHPVAVDDSGQRQGVKKKKSSVLLQFADY